MTQQRTLNSLSAGVDKLICTFAEDVLEAGISAVLRTHTGRIPHQAACFKTSSAVFVPSSPALS